MLISSIKNYKNILKTFPKLDIVFDFLLNNISNKTPDGRYCITKNIYAIVSISAPKPKKEQFLEAHKKYIDLQYVISNTDNIGWKFLDKSFKIYSNPSIFIFSLSKLNFLPVAVNPRLIFG